MLRCVYAHNFYCFSTFSIVQTCLNGCFVMALISLSFVSFDEYLHVVHMRIFHVLPVLLTFIDSITAGSAKLVKITRSLSDMHISSRSSYFLYRDHCWTKSKIWQCQINEGWLHACTSLSLNIYFAFLMWKHQMAHWVKKLASGVCSSLNSHWLWDHSMSASTEQSELNGTPVH